MLLHPFQDKIHTFPGTRILQDTLGIVGVQFYDLYEPDRVWTIQSLYAPVIKRALGGIRARVMDQKGFVSFVNQRDLEVILGLARPGTYCAWTQEDYPEPGDPLWFGLCVDGDDLADDLHERELFLRAYAANATLAAGQELLRRVHREQGSDEEELLTLRWDADPETGVSPDGRLETLDRRWVRIERRKLLWQRT